MWVVNRKTYWKKIGFLPFFTTMSKSIFISLLIGEMSLIIIIMGEKQNGSEICDDFFGSCHKGLWHPAIP